MGESRASASRPVRESGPKLVDPSLAITRKDFLATTLTWSSKKSVTLPSDDASSTTTFLSAPVSEYHSRPYLFVPSTCVIPCRAERNTDVLSAVDTSWTVRRSDSTLKIVGQRNRLLWDKMMAAK